MTDTRPTDADKLALVAAGFPTFRLWRETILDRTRYVAQGTSLDSHPHTVITDDLAELAASLNSGLAANRADLEAHVVDDRLA
jgi:hypothetical protein